jgi:hypothetical protein
MEGHMLSFENTKVVASTFIKGEDMEIRIEKLVLESGQEKIRLTSIVNHEVVKSPFILSEEQLFELLNNAIHSGVLHRNFIGKLRDGMEI